MIVDLYDGGIDRRYTPACYRAALEVTADIDPKPYWTLPDDLQRGLEEASRAELWISMGPG